MENSLPGSMAAEMSDWASRTLFMASSISLLDASFFIPGFKFSPAANGLSLQIPSIIIFSSSSLPKKRRLNASFPLNESAKCLTWGPWTAWASGSRQKEPGHFVGGKLPLERTLVEACCNSECDQHGAHLGVHVRARHSHGNHLLHVGSSKGCPSHLRHSRAKLTALTTLFYQASSRHNTASSLNHQQVLR